MARLDFANARLGARRTRLLGPDGLRALAVRASPELRLDAVRVAFAGAALPAPATPGAADLPAIEAALRADARREALALVRDVEGARQRALLAALLALDDVAAEKAALRAGAPAPGGAPPATGSAGVAAAELALDRAAFARARAAARGAGEDARLLAAHLADLVDARNAGTLLAVAGAAPERDPFLEGGARWTSPALLALARAGAAAASGAIGHGFRVTAGALARPWSAELAVERAVLAPLRRAARRAPLSIAVPLAYLAERRAEVRKVAVLLRAAAIGLPGDELLELLEA